MQDTRKQWIVLTEVTRTWPDIVKLSKSKSPGNVLLFFVVVFQAPTAIPSRRKIKRCQSELPVGKGS